MYNWLPVHPDVGRLLYGRTILELEVELTPQVCDLEISENNLIVEPPHFLKGDIARRTLYLIGRYNVAVPNQYMKMLLHWDESDPVTEAEYQVSSQVGKLQGSDNGFVSIRYRRSMKKNTQ